LNILFNFGSINNNHFSIVVGEFNFNFTAVVVWAV
jgi:hypothetical protein